MILIQENKPVQTEKRNTWFKTFVLKLQSLKYVYCLFLFLNFVYFKKVIISEGRGGLSAKDLSQVQLYGPTTPTLFLTPQTRRLHHFLHNGVQLLTSACSCSAANTICTQHIRESGNRSDRRRRAALAADILKVRAVLFRWTGRGRSATPGGRGRWRRTDADHERRQTRVHVCERKPRKQLALLSWLQD